MTLQDESTLLDPQQPYDDDAIPLPAATRRSESRRLRQQRRRHRRLQLLRYAGVALAVVVAASILIRLWPDGGGDGNDTNAAGRPAAAAANTQPPILLAQQDGAGHAVSLTLLIPAAKNKGGAILLIPPGTMTEVASLGLEPVGKSLGLGGAQRLDATVENLLGASIGEVLALDESRLVALVQPAGPLTVNVPERVETVDAQGRVTILHEPGVHKIQPQDVPAFLAVKGQGSDLSRLARHQALWDAWLARIRQDKATAPTQPPGLQKAFLALAAGDSEDVTTRVLPVQSLGATPEDGELYQVDDAGVRELVSTLFPGRESGAADRPRLQILNGTGAVGLAQHVSDRLLPLGVEVKLTGNAGRLDYQETQIVFYRRDDEEVAQRVQKALGVGRLVLSRNPLDVVDVTVIVGRDFKTQ
jgi:LytR cell envelope-related transcriptional attenuator